MKQTTDQIIQMIVQQTSLTREEILERIEKLSKSLRYNHERDLDC